MNIKHSPLLTYLLLIIFFASTVLTSMFDFGIWNEIFTWSFAVIKTIIILLAFMKFNDAFEDSRIYFLISVFAILIFMVGIMDDLYFRY